ncbi:hypothetical protein BDZ90DRAFT_259687 [Jaminaea rosea]|uniref:Tcp11-domain-containing protein n=1 Tax=Jaminaea rosea TaxID=1569628 RepID=A0A316UV46_9BASI|nr:hypothetical protein BDZ90DRAFT_259687 [Jaminaea rosea]PWN28658.1 hypothetical protein BDZ90DRAFT_259687 [Jaminaea rosea]
MDGTSTADEAAATALHHHRSSSMASTSGNAAAEASSSSSSARRLSNAPQHHEHPSPPSHSHLSHHHHHHEHTRHAESCFTADPLPDDIRDHRRSPSSSSSSSGARVSAAEQCEGATSSPAAAVVDPPLPQRRASGSGASSTTTSSQPHTQSYGSNEVGDERGARAEQSRLESNYAATSSSSSGEQGSAALVEAGPSASASATTASSPPWPSRPLCRTQSHDASERSTVQTEDRPDNSDVMTVAGPSCPRPIKAMPGSAASTPPDAPVWGTPLRRHGQLYGKRSSSRGSRGSPRRVRWEDVKIDRPLSRSPRAPCDDEEERRRKSSLSLSTREAKGQEGFQLQPAPQPKRRRVSQEGSSEDQASRGTGVDEQQPRVPPLPSLSRATLPPASVAGAPAAAQPSTSSISPPWPRTPAQNLFHMAAAVQQAFSALRLPAPSPVTAPTPTRPQATVSVQQVALRMPRLTRSHSLPNLRACTHGDPSQPSIHHLALPANAIAFLQSAYRASGLPTRDAAGNTPAFYAALRHSLHRAGRLPTHAAQEATPVPLSIPPTLPPITRSTLRELDMGEILKNPQLRHDVVFDSNVSFRPNWDGERGRKKREACERYWVAVGREVELGCTCTSFEEVQEGEGRLVPCGCVGRGDPARGMGRNVMPSRLPHLIAELRAICLSILPPASAYGAAARATVAGATSRGSYSAARAGIAHLASMRSAVSSHQSVLNATLDPSLISQQREHGVLDATAMLRVVVDILQQHCSPARESNVRTLVSHLEAGQVVLALRSCFELLELMKLDLANHQLRAARPLIVAGAVDFESQWFRQSVEQGVVSVEKTASWWGKAWKSAAETASPTVDRAFILGMMDLIMETPQADLLSSAARAALPLPLVSSTVSSSWLNHTLAPSYPETFQFDAYRLWVINNDLVDLVVVQMLLLLFSQLACSGTSDVNLLAARGRASALAQQQASSVKDELWVLLNEARETPRAAGSFKLRDPAWKAKVKDLLLHVAARAARVWAEATGRDAAPPSTGTQAMLESWLETTLQPGSTMSTLCYTRVGLVIAKALRDKLAEAGAQGVASWLGAAMPAMACADSAAGTARGGTILQSVSRALSQSNVNRSRGRDEAAGEDQSDRARKSPRREEREQRTQDATTSSQAATVAVSGQAAAPLTATATPSTTTLEAYIDSLGLSAIRAELIQLTTRISAVAALNYRTFYHLYGGMVGARQG